MTTQNENITEIPTIKRKPKSKLEDDSFIDWDFICSFAISLIAHAIIFGSLWMTIITLYPEAYNKAINSVKHPKDLIFTLIPDVKKDGEYSLEVAEKLFNPQKAKNNLNSNQSENK